MTTHRLRIEYEASAATPRGVLVEAQRIAAEAFGPDVEPHVEVGRVIEADAIRSSGANSLRQITRWSATVKATADVELTDEPEPPSVADQLAVAWGSAPPVPPGFPLYSHPGVQAVARELLGSPVSGDYWTKTVISNPATALHAAVRAVFVLDHLPSGSTS